MHLETRNLFSLYSSLSGFEADCELESVEIVEIVGEPLIEAV